MNSTKSDLLFALGLAGVLCPLAFYAVVAFGAAGTMVILFGPIAFLIRGSRKNQHPES